MSIMSKANTTLSAFLNTLMRMSVNQILLMKETRNDRVFSKVCRDG